MAYDASRETVLLFGGGDSNPETGGSEWNKETWEWDGQEWNLRSTEGPELRSGFRMFYDSARGKTVLMGGHEMTGRQWEWDGARWRGMEGGSVFSRSYFGLAYDTSRDAVLMFGGWNRNGQLLADTWEADVDLMKGDSDSDCDVDLLDFAVLQTCVGDMSADAACAQLDVDGSGWVDAADFAELFAMPTGPSEPQN